MTASAIREAAANFSNCVAGMWPDAARRHITQENFQSFTAGLTPDLRIMDLMDAQPEFTQVDLGLSRHPGVNDNRLAKGKEILAKYKPQFDAMEKAYGVDRNIVAAIWGIESNYSTQIGDRSVLQSTATLACIGRRQAYFKDEFLSALESSTAAICVPSSCTAPGRRVRRDAVHATAFKRYAVDADGDGRRGRGRQPRRPHCLHANNLKKGRLADRPELGLRSLGAEGLQLHSGGPLQEHDVCAVAAAGRQCAANNQPFPHSERQGLSLAPAGAAGPGFLMMQNFRVSEYNPAEAYALAIGHFADRLRVARPLSSPGRGRSANCRGPSGWSCSSSSPSAASTRAPRRPVWRRNPAGAAQLPGFRRGAGRRICHRGHAGTAPRTLKPSISGPKTAP